MAISAVLVQKKKDKENILFFRLHAFKLHIINIFFQNAEYLDFEKIQHSTLIKTLEEKLRYERFVFIHNLTLAIQWWSWVQNIPNNILEFNCLHWHWPGESCRRVDRLTSSSGGECYLVRTQHRRRDPGIWSSLWKHLLLCLHRHPPTEESKHLLDWKYRIRTYGGCQVPKKWVVSWFIIYYIEGSSWPTETMKCWGNMTQGRKEDPGGFALVDTMSCQRWN